MVYDKIKLVVGEYAGDYGFPLPNPVSMHREYPRLRFRIEWCIQEFQKRRYLVRSVKAFEMPNSIQPREYSMGGGTGSVWHETTLGRQHELERQ